MNKTLNKSPEMDNKDNQRRSSILKPRKSRNPSDTDIIIDPPDDDTTNFRSTRRVSFAASNYVKPFMVDADKDTIWDTTYEEKVNHTDSTHSSQEQSNKLGITTFTSTTSEVMKSEGTSHTIYDECTMEFTAMNMVQMVAIVDKENIVPSVVAKQSIIGFAKKIRTEDDHKPVSNQSEMEMTCQSKAGYDNLSMSMELESFDSGEIKTEVRDQVQEVDQENVGECWKSSNLELITQNANRTIYDESAMVFTATNITRENPIIIMNKENIFPPISNKESIIACAKKLASEQLIADDNKSIEMEMTCKLKEITDAGCSIMSMDCESIRVENENELKLEEIVDLTHSQVLFQSDFKDVGMELTDVNIGELPLRLNEENKDFGETLKSPNTKPELPSFIQVTPTPTKHKVIKCSISPQLNVKVPEVPIIEVIDKTETSKIITPEKDEVQRGDLCKSLISLNISQQEFPSFIQMTPTPSKEKMREIPKGNFLTTPTKINKRLLKKGSTPSPVPSKLPKPSITPKLDMTRIIKKNPEITIDESDVSKAPIGTPQNLAMKRHLKKDVGATPSPVPLKVRHSNSPATSDSPLMSKIPVATKRTTPTRDANASANIEMKTNILYSEKVSKTKLLNTPSFCDLKTPECSYKVNVNLLSPCIDDTHQLINCTLAKESFMASRCKNDTFAHSIAPEGSLDDVGLPNVTDLSRLDPSSAEISPICANKNKLSCVNDTYVLNKKKKRPSFEDWDHLVNQTANVAISDESLVNFEPALDISSDEVAKFLEYTNLKMPQLPEINFIQFEDRPEIRKEIAETKQAIVEFFRTRKFKKFDMMELLEEKDDNRMDSTSDGSQLTEFSSPGNFLNRSEDLFNAIKELEKNCNVWKLIKKEENVYFFTALCGTVLFQVELFAMTDHIEIIEKSSNLKKGSSNLALFLHKTLLDKLEESRIEAVIGPHYDILSLLTYIDMMVRKLNEFRIQFYKLGNFGLNLDENFMATFRLHSVPLPAILEITVDFTHLESLEGKDITIKQIIGSLNIDEFFEIAMVCPKGLDFIRKYVVAVDNYLTERSKMCKKKLEPS